MTQQITPELRQWIVDQAQAGHSAESVLQSMKASGWDEDVAIEAMESTLRGHLNQQAVAQGLPPAVKVPEPAVGDSPLYLDGGDRQVAVLGVMALPRLGATSKNTLGKVVPPPFSGSLRYITTVPTRWPPRLRMVGVPGSAGSK